MEAERPSKPPRVGGASGTSAAADRNSKLSALLASIDADLDLELELSAKAKAKAAETAEDDSGVNAFRRAKFFFPKVLEEQRKAKEAREAAAARKNKGKEKETKPSIRSSSPEDRANNQEDHDDDHEPKRRKVSHEERDSRSRGYSRSPTQSESPSPLGSPIRNGKGKGRASPLSPSASPSPVSRSRLDKGKGNATTHSVNSRVVYADAKGTGSPHGSPARQSQRSTRSSAKNDPVVVIDSTDDSDSDLDVDVKPSWQPKRSPVKAVEKKTDTVAEVTDPEFAEYIERARIAAAKAKKEAELESVFGKSSGEAVGPGGIFSSNTTVTTPATTNPTSESQATTASAATRSASNLTQSGEAADGTPTEPDARSATPSGTTVIPSSQPAHTENQYRVFITSHLPSPVPPLIAMMRMDQEMKYVRNAYLNHAAKHGVSLSEDESASVLLTWKGSKIYNFTTGTSLGIRPDAKGRFRDHNASASGSGFQSGGLHLEIWTDALYNEYLEAEDRRRRRNLGELVEEISDDDEEDGDDVKQEGHDSARASAAPEAGSSKIRLVLNSRDYEKLRITAHSDTTIDTLATAFRLQRGIPPEQTVIISWDGDELEGSMTVGEAEMEDMDSVEVHIR